MASVPTHLEKDALPEFLFNEGFQRMSQGKVRNTYTLNEKYLLVVATDRVSIFDFVLGNPVPNKGEVLTALTHFWLTKILPEFRNHLISSAINHKFNAAYDMRASFYPDLSIERCLIVRNMKNDLYPFEMIYRHHIGGSIFKSYQKTGIVSGVKIEANLPKWSKLRKPLFTPSTKEEIGHDINVNAQYFFDEMSKQGKNDEAVTVFKMLSDAYAKAYSYAEEKGILILDTKFEVAGKMIVDEILTPDSSRFVLKDDWEKAMEEGRDPYFYDKQLVRDWGAKVPTNFFDDKGEKIVGINKLDPKNPDHVNFVHNLKIPYEIIKETTRRYLKIFELLTGKTLEEYQRNDMGV